MMQKGDENDPGGESEDGDEVVCDQSGQAEGLAVGNEGERDPREEQAQGNATLDQVAGEKGLHADNRVGVLKQFFRSMFGSLLGHFQRFILYLR